MGHNLKVCTFFLLSWTFCASYHIEIVDTVPYGNTIFNASVDLPRATYLLSHQNQHQPFSIDKNNGNLIFTPKETFSETRQFDFQIKVQMTAGRLTIPLTITVTKDDSSIPEISVRHRLQLRLSNHQPSVYELLANIEQNDSCPNSYTVASLCQCKMSQRELIGDLNPHSKRYMQHVDKCSTGDSQLPEQTVIIEITNSPRHVKVVHSRRSRRSSNIRFTNRLFNAYVGENLPPNQPVKQMQVVDSNGLVQSGVEFRIAPSSKQESIKLFAIDINTGQITTKKLLDREKERIHHFIVSARRGYSTAKCYLDIHVVDENDNTPEFENPRGYNVSVLENTSNATYLTNVRATDADSGDNGAVSYRILRSQPHTQSFAIRPNGDLFTNGPIDREAVSGYKLIIQAKDHGETPKSASVTVYVAVRDINDNYPKFSKSEYDATVKEDVRRGTSVVNVTATDSDQGLNGRLSYDIFDGNTNRKFIIDRNSGAISVNNLLDYDVAPQNYVLRVRASDSGRPMLSNASGIVKIRVVDVNDNGPSFVGTYAPTIREDIGVGDRVEKVIAVDEDFNSRITYSIVPGRNPPFHIEARSGIITVARKIDYEATKSFSFTVQATDNGVPRRSARTKVTVTVLDVNDNAPRFTSTHYGVKLAEDTSLGAEILRITAEDPDREVSSILIYEIINGNKDRTFNMATRNGVGIITLLRKLDFNIKKQYQLTVRVTDGSLTSTTPVYINVTDTNSHQPMFDRSYYYVPLSEDVSVNTLVVKVHASDDDIGDNSRITYCFKEPASQFTINAVNGEIRTRATLDFETNPQIILFIRAHDNGIPQKDDHAEVIIDLSDANDNAPVFPRKVYTGSISEASDRFERVLQIKAHDRDSGVKNADIHYTFENGDDGDGSFSIDWSSGIIRTAQLLDRESVSRYSLIAYAVDGGDPALSSSVTVIVNVEDVDDNPPRFPQDVLTFKVKEDVRVGDVVATVHAVDPDIQKPGSEIFYELDHDPVVHREWSIDPKTGELSTLHKLDYETQKNYSIVVTAMSEGLVSQATVIIQVQDCNDNDPVLDNFEIIFNNYRTGRLDSFPTGIIGRVPAFDPDVSDNLTYSFVAGNKGNLLLMDKATGDLRLNSTLDSNRQYSVPMVIRVTDGERSTKANCTLRVTGISDTMLQHSITVRILNMNAYTFLSPVMYEFNKGLSEILNISSSSIYIFNVQNDTDVSREVLNVSFSVKDVNGSLFPSKYLQDQIYLNRLTLTKLTGKNVLPFDDNICLREPCQNYKRCTSVLTFDSTAPFISSMQMIFRPIYPVYRLKCECPIGFTNDVTCSDEVDLCYSDPCQNGAECNAKEGGFVCKCTRGFAGSRCEIDLNKGHCEDHIGICQNGGKCTNTGAEGGFACSCSGVPGVSSPREETTNLCALRTRQFRKGNYLTLSGIKNQWHFTFSLSFATIQSDGLLFYNGRLNHEHDFMTLELVQGQVMLNFSTGQSWAVVDPYVAGGLNDGNWHTVHIQYYNEPKPGPLPSGVLGRSGPSANKIAVVTVDPGTCDYMVAANWDSKYGNYSCSKQVIQGGDKNSLDLTSPLLLGGVPDLPEAFQVRSKSFEGCLRDVTIDGAMLDLGRFVANNGSTPGCSPMLSRCKTLSCFDRGTCQPTWDDFRCNCRGDQFGRRCQHSSGFVGSLKGKGCLSYRVCQAAHSSNCLAVPTFMLPWKQSLAFRTFQSDAYLMQVGIGGKAISLDFVLRGGHVTFVITSGSSPPKELPLVVTAVNDGRWHEVALDLKRTSNTEVRLSVFLDGSVEQAHLEYPPRYLASLRVTSLHIGGRMVDGNVDMPLNGCFQNIMLGPPDHLRTVSTQSFTPIGGAQFAPKCSSQNPCMLSRCPRNSDCVSDWTKYSCKCHKGYAGSDCVSVCSLGVCKNGATCANQPSSARGYTCRCPRGFTGTHCEQGVIDTCPPGWFGNTHCAPCNCSNELNFDSRCDVDTGACNCKKYHYYVPSSGSCRPCKCYPFGSNNQSCIDVVGQCSCRDGISGRQCTKCTYKFAEIINGACQVLHQECPRSLHSDIWWPRTKVSARRAAPCPAGAEGVALRRCDPKDSWEDPDLSNCTSRDFGEFSSALHQLESNKTKLNQEKSLHLSEELNKVTYGDRSMYENDLVNSYRLIRALLEFQSNQSDFDLTTAYDVSFTDNLVSASSNLFNNGSLRFWGPPRGGANRSSEALGEEQLSAPLLVRSWEDYTSTLLANMNPIYLESCVVRSKHINADIKMVKDRYQDYTFDQSDSDGSGQMVQVRLPAYLFKPTPGSGNLVTGIKPTVGILTYKRLDQVFPETFEVDRTFRVPKKPSVSSILVTVQVYATNPSDDSSKRRGKEGKETGSDRSQLVRRLDEPVVITFKLTKPKTIEPQCVFWNYTASGTGSIAGGWSHRGCTREFRNASHVTCSCNHLTTFAVVTDEEVTSILTSSISTHVILVIGVSASLAFLIGSIAASLFLPGVKSIRARINRNLAIALFLSSIIYLLGIQQTSNVYLCMAIAVGLHFLVMSSFAWVLVDGVHLYRVLTERRDVNRGKMRVYYLLGWVLPAIITALSVGLEAKGYANPLFCWISIDDLLIWSIAGPALLCCGIFLLLFLLSVQAYLSSKSPAMKREEILREMRASSLVAPAVASTWTLALLAVNRNQDWYFYAFAFSSVLESVLVFVFHCLLNKEMKKAYRKYKERSLKKHDHNSTTQQLLRASMGRTPDSSVRGGLPRFNNSTSESLSLTHFTPRRPSPIFDSMDVSDSDCSDASYEAGSSSDSSMSLASSSGDDELDMNTLQNIRNTRPENSYHPHHYPVARGNGSSRTGQSVKFRPNNRSDEDLSNQSNETEF